MWTSSKKFMAAGLLSAGIFGLAATAVAPARAADKPTVVVMGEDYDEESVPRNNRIFKRVIQALTEELNVAGFDVYDETAVGMEITEPNRVRRRDTELIEVARSLRRPPIDLIVIFQIYASARQLNYSDIMRPEVRIPGRILNVRTGQAIASFDTGGPQTQLAPLPRNCDRQCLLEQVGGEAQMLGRDLAIALGEKLKGFMAARGRPVVTDGPDGRNEARCEGLTQGYTVTVEGFSNAEITALEEYLASFKCYQHHRPLRVQTSRSEYWYETTADSARLNRNLRLTLEHMNVKAVVDMSPNTIRIRKVATR